MIKRTAVFIFIIFTGLHVFAGDLDTGEDNSFRILSILALLGAGILAIYKLKNMNKK